MSRDSSWKLHGSLSYSLCREDDGGFSGMVVTVHGIVSVHSSVPNELVAGRRSFAMAFKGRMYHRIESGATITSSKHGANLAGRFARDVAIGRIR